MTFADFLTKLRWIGKKTDCDDSTIVFIAMVVEKEALFFLRRPVQKKQTGDAIVPGINFTVASEPRFCQDSVAPHELVILGSMGKGDLSSN